MCVIETRIFGKITVDEKKKIHFPDGILGFPELKNFVLLHDAEKNFGVHWMQSIDEPNFAMPVIDPLIINDNYTYTYNREQIDCEDPYVLVTMTVPTDITKMSINLMAPFIIDPDTRKAAQVIQEGYTVKTFVYDKLKAQKEHYEKVWLEHDMNAAEAWKIYSGGIRPDDTSEKKEIYIKAIHRMRQATKEGYMLCRVDKAIKDISSLGLGLQDVVAITQILREACE